jgi:hypothetical protein
MKELLKLLHDWDNWGEGESTQEDRKAWLKKYLDGELILDKKIELANAVIEEAGFNGIDLNLLTDKIEHQLGTVWVGKDSYTQTLPIYSE